jgi:LPXTG-motif cell wall-anchored protein
MGRRQQGMQNPLALNPYQQPPGAFYPPLLSYQTTKEPSKKWVLWLIGGLIGLVLLGLVVYFFVKKRKSNSKR